MKTGLLYYERRENRQKALVRTLAGDLVIVSYVLVEGKRYEIMVFKADHRMVVIDYEPYDEYTTEDRAESYKTFDAVVKRWSNEERTLDDISTPFALTR